MEMPILDITLTTPFLIALRGTDGLGVVDARDVALRGIRSSRVSNARYGLIAPAP